MLPESGPPKCLSFGNIDECEEWMRERREKKPVESPVQNLSSEPRCVCKAQGPCSPLPHRHSLRHKRQRSASTLRTIACDNHLEAYLSTDWFEVAMICSYCCEREPMDGDGICEHCATENGLLKAADLKTDAIRVKEQGYCINRELVHGCLTFTDDPNENMCVFCRNYLRNSNLGENPVSSHKHQHNTRVRMISTSTRPCRITPGCTGNMTANVRRYNAEQKPQLWWTCAVCKANSVAQSTTAVPAPMSGGAED